MAPRRDVEGALKLLARMRQQGLEPSRKVFLALVEVCATAEDSEGGGEGGGGGGGIIIYTYTHTHIHTNVFMNI
jgi:hypothetical protein